jgi:uncharacterized protein YjbI with pentapeptide repeats
MYPSPSQWCLQAYAQKAILAGANLTNAVVDRVDFTNANLKGAKVGGSRACAWVVLSCRQRKGVVG